MVEHCPTCFSSNRKLTGVTQTQLLLFQAILPTFEKTIEFCLCWECSWILRRIELFCERALKCKTIYEKHRKHLKLSNKESKSSLCVTKTEVVTFINSESEGFVELSEENANEDFNKNNSSKRPKFKNGKKTKRKRLKVFAGDFDNVSVNENGWSRPKGKVRTVERRPKTCYRCKVCGLLFQTRGTYEYHMEGHRPRPKCEVCGRMFVSKSVLWRHNNLVHKDTSKYTCDICNKILFTEAGYQVHTASHQNGQDIFFCQPCGKFFKTNSSFRKHQRVSVKHYDPQTWKFNCAECNRRFQTEIQFKEHYDMIHLKINKFKCKLCPRQYCREQSLKVHVQLKHENIEQPKNHVCDICGKRFKWTQTLKSHMQVHTGARPHACALCPARFTQSSALRTHKRLVHLREKRNK